MATKYECDLTAESKIGKYISVFDQENGQTIVDIDDKLMYGFEQTILNNIKTSQSQYSSIIIYKKGDIVSFENGIFIARSTIVNELPTNNLYFKKLEFDKELDEEKLNIVSFITVKNGAIAASKNIDIANSNLSNDDDKTNWSILFEDALLQTYTVLFSDLTSGEQGLGSSKIGLRKIKNKTGNGFDVQFQSDSVDYNDVTILIYGTK